MLLNAIPYMGLILFIATFLFSYELINIHKMNGRYSLISLILFPRTTLERLRPDLEHVTDNVNDRNPKSIHYKEEELKDLRERMTAAIKIIPKFIKKMEAIIPFQYDENKKRNGEYISMAEQKFESYQQFLNSNSSLLQNSNSSTDQALIEKQEIINEFTQLNDAQKKAVYDYLQKKMQLVEDGQCMITLDHVREATDASKEFIIVERHYNLPQPSSHFNTKPQYRAVPSGAEVIARSAFEELFKEQRHGAYNNYILQAAKHPSTRDDMLSKDLKYNGYPMRYVYHPYEIIEGHTVHLELYEAIVELNHQLNPEARVAHSPVPSQTSMAVHSNSTNRASAAENHVTPSIGRVSFFSSVSSNVTLNPYSELRDGMTDEELERFLQQL
ncbi:MAG TPA: hypothetical protein VHD33_02115 [Legionellaceae bacterium]|nr:hypothetical protein [Legionellaceae bacterium]